MDRRSFLGSVAVLLSSLAAKLPAQTGQFWVEPDLTIPPIKTQVSSGHEAELRLTFVGSRVDYFFLILRPNINIAHYATTILELLRRAGLIDRDKPERNFRPVKAQLGNQAFFEIITLDEQLVQSIFQLPKALPIKADITGPWWFAVGDGSSPKMLVPNFTNVAQHIIGPQAWVAVILEQRPELPREKQPAGTMQFRWSDPGFPRLCWWW